MVISNGKVLYKQIPGKENHLRSQQFYTIPWIKFHCAVIESFGSLVSQNSGFNQFPTGRLGAEKKMSVTPKDFNSVDSNIGLIRHKCKHLNTF